MHEHLLRFFVWQCKKLEDALEAVKTKLEKVHRCCHALCRGWSSTPPRLASQFERHEKDKMDPSKWGQWEQHISDRKKKALAELKQVCCSTAYRPALCLLLAFGCSIVWEEGGLGNRAGGALCC